MVNLKKIRQEKEITQKELANIIGYNQTVISQWEHGTRDPSTEALIKLSKIFNVSVDEILGLKKESATKDESTNFIPAKLKPIIDELIQLNDDGLKAVEMFVKGYIAGSRNDEEINFYN